jgi:hypothetical protein
MAQEIWQAYDGGATLQTSGPDGGTIIHDMEHPAGARIMVERDCLRAPYAIHTTVYGWPSHIRYIADEPTALDQAVQMQASLVDVLALMPAEEDEDYAERYEAAQAAFEAYEERFV